MFLLILGLRLAFAISVVGMGQISKSRLVCALPEPKGFVSDEYYARVRYCQRVGVKRGTTI